MAKNAPIMVFEGFLRRMCFERKKSLESCRAHLNQSFPDPSHVHSRSSHMAKKSIFENHMAGNTPILSQKQHKTLPNRSKSPKIIDFDDLKISIEILVESCPNTPSLSIPNLGSTLEPIIDRFFDKIQKSVTIHIFCTHLH